MARVVCRLSSNTSVGIWLCKCVNAESNRLGMQTSAVSTPSCDAISTWLTYLRLLRWPRLTHVSSRGRWAQQHLQTLYFRMAGLELRPLIFAFGRRDVLLLPWLGLVRPIVQQYITVGDRATLLLVAPINPSAISSQVPVSIHPLHTLARCHPSSDN